MTVDFDVRKSIDRWTSGTAWLMFETCILCIFGELWHKLGRKFGGE